jgi:CAAX amino terminal protease family.
MNKRSYDTNKNLIVFFAITLLWTWSCGLIPFFLKITGTPLGNFIFYFGGGAPSVVGLFMVFKTYPKETRKDYFRRCFDFKRLSGRWFLFVVTYFGATALLALWISVKLFHYGMPGMNWLKIAVNKPYMIPILLFFSFISGPLNEEFGWRGYALDKLLVRFGYGKASLLLGFIWGIWHLGWYFTPGQAQYEMLQDSLPEAILFIPETIILSYVVTYVYINTRRSIFAAAFVHMAGNLFTSQLLAPFGKGTRMIMEYTGIAFGVILIIYSVRSGKFKETSRREILNIPEQEKI